MNSNLKIDLVSHPARAEGLVNIYDCPDRLTLMENPLSYIYSHSWEMDSSPRVQILDLVIAFHLALIPLEKV